MERESVKSKNIASIGYDETSEILEIEFISGGIYHYLDVPSFVYDELMDAESHGKYFAANIKDKYETERIK